MNDDAPMPSDPARRRFLGTGLLAAAAWNLGGSWWQRAVADEAFNATAVPPAFLQVSAALCGALPLPATQAQRLYTALRAAHTNFDTQLQALALFLREPGHGVSSLQADLDAAKLPFASLPRAITTAWFVGVVGDGEQAQCIEYERALMNVSVADQLRPPSYAYGSYGSWALPPTANA